MPNSIEIFENTLLQLITRQGTDNDRTEIVLKPGELGYTTDTKRLFVGDGSTFGGNVAGNKFKGYTTNLTSLGSGLIGDIAYKTDEKSIYAISSGDGTVITDWTKIGAMYTAADGSINITLDNKISVLSLSAGKLSNDLMGQSITLDSTKRLTLSSTIATNSIVTQRNTQYLKLPQFLSINSNDYTFPAGELGNNKYLKTDAVGRLSWSSLGSNANYFTYTTGGVLPVGTIISTITPSSLNDDWVICDGQLLTGVNYPELSAAIGIAYGGDNVQFRVPNLNNDMLYGTDISPLDATIYTFTSGTSINRSSLSAFGVNFFIKAKPNKVINGTVQIDSPLNITINGTAVNDTKIPILSALSNDVELSLPSSRIKINSPLNITKDSTNVTGSFVSIFDGDLNISGPTNTLKVDSPLKLTVGGTDKTGENISPYDGNLNLKLNTGNTIKADFPVSLFVNGTDKTGQAIDLDTPNQNITLDVNFTNIMNMVYPVGSILFSIDNTNPQNRFGGAWIRVSQGRYLAGQGTTTDNNSVSNTFANGGDNGGNFNATISTPSHRHGVGEFAASTNDDGYFITGVAWNDGNTHSTRLITGNTNSAGYLNKSSAGALGMVTTYPVDSSSYTINVKPPSYVMYVWQRTELAS